MVFMKKKIISIILLIAMVLSQIMPFPRASESELLPPPEDKRDNNSVPQDNSGAPTAENLGLEFSHKPGFYDSEFTLSLTAPEGAEIYYTTSRDITGVEFEHPVMRRHDGGVAPTVNSTSYSAPITVSLPPQVAVFTISAIIVVDGVVSAPVTNSYIIGRNVGTRFEDDLLVFSLYSDANGLFCFHNGILVPGVDRQDWIDEYERLGGSPNFRDYQRQNDYPPTLPANFNRRGRAAAERPVHVEMFDAKGQRHISQRAGMRVKGGWSRGTFLYEQRTFELYARNSYGDRSDFMFPLFGEQHSADGNLMYKYRRFRLRNGGTDREQSYIRDELSHELYKQAGFPDVQNHAPGVVFLNGEYYGLVWLKTPRTEDHFQKIYGGNEDGFKMIGSNERGRVGCGRISCGRVIIGAGIDRPAPGQGVVRCTDREPCDRFDCLDFHTSLDAVCAPLGYCLGVDDWQKLRALALGTGGEANPNGLTDDASFAEFCSKVDIDNLIHYYALGMYIANVDWPANNIEMWKYYAQPGEANLHPHLDGKWRFIAQDLEFGYGLWSDGSTPAGTRPTENTLRHVINRTADPNRPGAGHFNATDQTFIMSALMKRADMRAKLANTFIDLIEGAYEPTNAVAVFERLRRQIEPEHNRMLSAERRISEIDRLGNPGSWPDSGAVSNSNRQIRNFLEQRPASKLSHIESELGFAASARSAVTLINGEGGTAIMNTRPVAENTTVIGNYYNGTSIVIAAQPFPGYSADSPVVTVQVTGAVTITMTYSKVFDFEYGVTKTVEVSQFGYQQIQALGRDGRWYIKGRADVFVPPEIPPEIPPETTPGTQPPEIPPASGDVTAALGENRVQINNIPESGAWSVSVTVDRWPPTGGPWGAPDGVSFIYNNGVLTISGNGRHGWGDNWTVTWGFW
jgi:hypothetical protein